MAPKKKVIGGKGGKPPVSFTPGGLHKSLGVPQGQKIPPGKMASALGGNAGPKAAAQARLATGLLAAGRKTAARNRSKSSGKTRKKV